MTSVGAFEAKTHLSMLLDRVASGEEITITKHGKPVARLVGAHDADQSKMDEVVQQLRDIRKGARLDGLSWKALRDEGRR